MERGNGMKSTHLTCIAALLVMAAAPSPAARTEHQAKALKFLVVYYSCTGNTEIVAKALADRYKTDIVKLEEVRPCKESSLHYAAVLIPSMFGCKSEIKPVTARLDAYDIIFIGSPVWCCNPAPAVNAFVSSAELKGRNIVLFFTMAKNDCSGAVKHLTERIEERSGKVIGSFGISSGGTTLPQMKEKTVEFFKNMPDLGF